MTRYRTDHAEEWRNELAQEMNNLLGAIQHVQGSFCNGLYNRTEKLCARLAEAEEIKEA